MMNMLVVVMIHAGDSGNDNHDARAKNHNSPDGGTLNAINSSKHNF